MYLHKYWQHRGLNPPKSTMCALSCSEVEKIIHLIDSGHSNCQIAFLTHHSTYTISHIWSEHHPDVLKSSGGHPSELSPADIHHAVHLINTGKADNATQVAHSLQAITNQSLSMKLFVGISNRLV